MVRGKGEDLDDKWGFSAYGKVMYGLVDRVTGGQGMRGTDCIRVA